MKGGTSDDLRWVKGRLAVITGATGGLGYETALALAGAGAQVLLTGRDQTRGDAALARIRAMHPDAGIDFRLLDLGSLASVRDFAGRFACTHAALDILINNGGVMAPPVMHATVDGFELQFGTNYLSHFALTGQLLPSLMRSRSARVVNLSSLAHRWRSPPFLDETFLVDGPIGRGRYRAFEAYAQSKLAMLMFTIELQRRSDLHGWGLTSVAAHPGLARTALLRNGQRLACGRKARALAAALDFFNGLLPAWLIQTASEGARATLYAATAPDVAKAGYYGPTGLMAIGGRVGPAAIAARALDREESTRLWEASERMTGVHFESTSMRALRSVA